MEAGSGQALLDVGSCEGPLVVIVGLCAYVALGVGPVLRFFGVFALSSRGFRQDRQVVAEDRAADGRCEILKAAKTASSQPECTL